MTQTVVAPGEMPTTHIDAVREIEPSEPLSLSVGFDREMLAALKPEDIIDDSRFGAEEKVPRVREVLELYGRLPERLVFEPGMTAIFGENGSGKTLLADVILMAVKMQQFRQKHGIAFGEPLDSDDVRGPSFHPMLSGIRGSGTDHRLQATEASHAEFVARIAACMRVHEAEIYPANRFDMVQAHLAAAALGGIEPGLSTHQQIEELFKYSSQGKRGNPSFTFLDEPEMGKSPRRQRVMKDEILESVGDTIGLVPSNSILLFEDKDIARIDLAHPERGIYIPSESDYDEE